MSFLNTFVRFLFLDCICYSKIQKSLQGISINFFKISFIFRSFLLTTKRNEPILRLSERKRK